MNGHADKVVHPRDQQLCRPEDMRPSGSTDLRWHADDTLLAHYAEMARSPDPDVRRLAEAQLARLRRATRASVPPRTDTDTGSDMLVGLIEHAVGPLRERRNGALVGPCPWHASRSGECLVIFPDRRGWWCASCHRGGDVARFLGLIEGIGYGEARRRLGLPTTMAVRRPVIRVEVS